MDKIQFTSKLYKYILITALILLTVLNCYISISVQNPRLLIFASFDLIILLLVQNRNKFLKPSIIVWALIFLILIPLSFSILGYMLTYGEQAYTPRFIVWYAKILLGFIILIGVGSIKPATAIHLKLSDHLIEK